MTTEFPSKLHIQPLRTSEKESRPPWKEAASLIILSKLKNDLNEQNQDYQILMVKRSSSSSFFASAFVFPGGQLEESDFNLRWLKLFEKYGFYTDSLKCLSNRIVGPRPPIITDPLTLKWNKNNQASFLNSDLALRICAIRETFEEAGILLLTKTHDQNNSNMLNDLKLDAETIKMWQKRVNKDGEEFYRLCDDLGMVPNIWSLYEWSNWLTPVNVGHKRFDTLFYICCFENSPPIYVDNKEVTTPTWCSPTVMLEKHQNEEIFLAPPQVYELSRMLQFNSLKPFFQFIRTRQTLGCQRWLPVIRTYNDGAISLVPGDEEYPADPQLITNLPNEDLNGSIFDSIKQAKMMNRMELQGIRCRAFCNIKPGCGHLPPITYPLLKTDQNLLGKL